MDYCKNLLRKLSLNKNNTLVKEIWLKYLSMDFKYF